MGTVARNFFLPYKVITKIQACLKAGNAENNFLHFLNTDSYDLNSINNPDSVLNFYLH
jgi:hypothetical protein